MKITKGKWSTSDKYLNCVVSGDRIIANCGAYQNNCDKNVSAENEANALLISKAPELLQSLTEMVNTFKSICFLYGWDYNDYCEAKKAIILLEKLKQ